MCRHPFNSRDHPLRPPGNLLRACFDHPIRYFHKIYDDGALAIGAGQQIYSFTWSQLGNVSNGLYDVVVVEERGGKETHTVLKLMFRR